MEEYLTVADFAKIAGTSHQNIYRKLNQEEMRKYVKVEGKRRVIHKDALQLFASHDDAQQVRNEEIGSAQDVRNISETDAQGAQYEKKSLMEKEKRIEWLENQLQQAMELLKKEQENSAEIQKQMVRLSGEVVEIAKQSNTLVSQAQVLQGQLQNGSNMQPPVRTDENVVAQDVRNNETECAQGAQQKKPSFFARLFGRV